MTESTIRKYRIDDATYTAATERAAREGTDVSKLIRQWLGDYAANIDALAYRPTPTPGSLLDELDELVGRLRAEVGTKAAARPTAAQAINEFKAPAAGRARKQTSSSSTTAAAV